MVFTVAAWRMTKAVEGVASLDEPTGRVEEGLPRATRQWELRKTLLLREASTEDPAAP
jgi:hypothetical protein